MPISLKYESLKYKKSLEDIVMTGYQPSGTGYDVYKPYVSGKWYINATSSSSNISTISGESYRVAGPTTIEWNISKSNTTNNYYTITPNTHINAYLEDNETATSNIYYSDVDKITWTTNGNATYTAADWGNYVVTDLKPRSVKDLMRDAMKRRSSPAIHVKREGIGQTTDVREMRARATLRRVVGDEQFKRFLKSGFVTVKGKSGLVYQIKQRTHMVTAYEKGKAVERLCVFLAGEFPPTDQIIVLYLMFLNNETQVRATANISNLRERENGGLRIGGNYLVTNPAANLADLSLPEIFSQLKGAV
jgi:hypothetical protein